MDHALIETLYGLAKDTTSWETKLRENCGFTDEDMRYVDWIKTVETPTNAALRRWERAVDRDGGIELHNAETFDERVQLLSELLARIETEYEERAKAGVPYMNRVLFLEAQNYAALRARRETYRKFLAKSLDQKLSDSDIEQARQVPLEELVDVPRSKKILCIFHEDRSPSMFVKNGFGYCFTCGAWCDSIKWWMTQNNSSFTKAVEALSRR